MSFNAPLAWVPMLNAAMARHPLTVPPDALLEEVIALIRQSHSDRCTLEKTVELAVEELAIPEARLSCVLVIQETTLIGIFTERDIVQLTATGMSFTGVKIADVMTSPVTTLAQSAFHDIFAALFLFRRYRIRHLPIVDDQDQVIGVVSPESIRQILRPANLLRLRRVADVMVKQVVHAPPEASILDLARLMADHQISCVIITEPDLEDRYHPIGIVTERDIVQFQALQINLAKTQAETVMSSPLFLLSPEDSLWIAHQEMQRRRVGRLVVSWNWGRNLGLITQTGLLRVFDPMEMYGVIENLQCTIQQLQTAHPDQSPTSPAECVEPVQFPPVPLSVSTPLNSAVGATNVSSLRAVESPDLGYSEPSLPHSYELHVLLKTIRSSLTSLAAETTMDSQQRQTQLNQAIAQLDRLQNLLDKTNLESLA
jgi:CBS domain-containing protein